MLLVRLEKSALNFDVTEFSLVFPNSKMLSEEHQFNLLYENFCLRSANCNSGADISVLFFY